MNESFENLMINSYELANLRGKYERLQAENAQLKKQNEAMQKVCEAAKQLKTIFMSTDVLMVDDDLEEEFRTTYHSLKDALEALDKEV